MLKNSMCSSNYINTFKSRKLLLKTLRHKGQLIDRLVDSGEGVIDSEDIIGVPSTERLLVNNSGALTDSPRN